MPEALALMQQADRARREARTADAHRDYAEAVRLSRQAGNRRELIRALKGLGQIERDLGNRDAARTGYEEAVVLCRGENDELLLAHTARHLGDIHRESGRADLAGPLLREALGLYGGHAKTAPLDLAKTLRPLAILEEGAGRVEEARRLWAQARDLYAAVGVAEGVAESSTRLAALGEAPGRRP